jgi:hypothetical protein
MTSGSGRRRISPPAADTHEALLIAGHQRVPGRVQGDCGDALPVRADRLALAPTQVHEHDLKARARPLPCPNHEARGHEAPAIGAQRERRRDFLGQAPDPVGGARGRRGVTGRRAIGSPARNLHALVSADHLRECALDGALVKEQSLRREGLGELGRVAAEELRLTGQDGRAGLLRGEEADDLAG